MRPTPAPAVGIGSHSTGHGRRVCESYPLAFAYGGHEDVRLSDEQNVVRMWRGVVRTADRDEYVDYVERTGVEEYRSTPGNRDAWTLTRELPDGLTEIMTVSRWDSLESIRGFAGDDIEKAVYYPEDDRFLVERDDTVRHYVQRS